MQAVTGLHRKSLIRLIKGDLARKPRRKQRGRTYGAGVEKAISIIAECLDYLCAERLQPNLVWLAEHLAQHGELELSPALIAQLERISISTVKRILQRIRQDEHKLPRRKPSRSSSVTRGVPMKRIAWDEQTPGHCEVDLVHHGGPSASGQYVHTLQMIDVTTAWSERVAVLGRSYRVMEAGFRRILNRLPFGIIELHPDNGSEFFNAHMLRFWKDTLPDLKLSRSRPYRKNDNPFVEQKNSSLARDPLGYQRFDTVAQTLALNDLYDQMWLYYNFFQPVMRVSEKILTTTSSPARIKRRYDKARTPLDRLCQSGVLSTDRRDSLLALRDRLNPRQLRQGIYVFIDYLYSLPGADPEQTEDIFQTLSQPIVLVKGEDISVTLSFEPAASLR